VGRCVEWSSAGLCIWVLFIVFGNELDVNVKGKMLKFAADAKIVGRVGCKD